MAAAETIRHSLRQAQSWRDVLWESVLEALERRNPTAARAIHEATQAQKVHRVMGNATREAVLAWPFLDVQSRQEWIWACQYIQELWLRDALAATASDQG